MSNSRLAVVAPAVAETNSRAAVIDEYGELDRRIQAFEPVRKRHESLKAQIKSWYDNDPADFEATAEGQLYTVQVSARETESTVAMAKAYRELGKERFLAACSITIKALTEALGTAAALALIRKARTGSRRLKVVAKASPQAA